MKRIEEQRIKQLEQRIEERRTTKDEDRRRELNKQITAELYGYFHGALRPLAAKAIRGEFADVQHDQSLGYTTVLNEAFGKLWAQAHTWQGESVRDLKNETLTIIRRTLIDLIRKRDGRPRKGQQGTDQDPIQPVRPKFVALDDPQIAVAQAALAAEVADHLRNRFEGVELLDLLLKLDEWAKSSDKKLQRHARVLQEHYLIGVPWDEVEQHEEQITPENEPISRTQYRHAKAAVDALKRAFRVPAT